MADADGERALHRRAGARLGPGREFAAPGGFRLRRRFGGHASEHGAQADFTASDTPIGMCFMNFESRVSEQALRRLRRLRSKREAEPLVPMLVAPERAPHREVAGMARKPAVAP